MIKNLVQNAPLSSIDSSHYKAFQYGHQLLRLNGDDIDLKEIQVAILAWETPQYADIQASLYALASNFKAGKVLDIGLALDQEVPLVELIDILLQNDVFPIIISAASQAIKAQLKAYEQRYEMLSLALVNSMIDYQVDNEEGLINQLLQFHPHLLFHLNCIGYQSFLNDKEAIDFLEDKYFETHRLGKVRAGLQEIEPMVRHVDLAAFSLSAIRCADAPANHFKNPNGFFAPEACKVMRYITMSDQLSSLTIHGFDLSIEDGQQSANMIAQLIWFAVEGFFARTNEFPIDKKDLIAYVVDSKALGLPLSFYKSNRSDRWWFEIPKALHNKHQLLPCSYQDYQLACAGELPDRLLNAINRLA